MADHLKLFNGIWHFSGLSLVASCLSLVFMLTAAASVGLEEYGMLVLFLAICQTIEGVSSSQSWQGVARYFNQGFLWARAPRTFLSLMSVDLFNVFLVILSGSVAILVSSDIETLPYPFLMLVLAVIPKVISVPVGLVRVRNYFAFLGLNMVVCQLIKLVGLFALSEYYTESFGIVDIIIIYIISEWIFFGCNIFRLMIDKNFLQFLTDCTQEKFSLVKLDAEALKFQAFCHMNCASVLSVRHLDEIIVGLFLSFELLGVWKILKLGAGIVGKIIEPLYLFVFPKLEELDVKDEDRKFVEGIISKSIAYFLVLSSLGFLLLILAPYVSDLFGLSLDLVCAGVLIFWTSFLNLLFFFAHPLAIRCRREKDVLFLNLVSGFLFVSILFIVVRWEVLSAIALVLFIYAMISQFGRLKLATMYMRSECE